ncbi:tRNAse Z TRZ4, mitochondrial-like [Salvia splendens]|uniref:tRNAse Z TRZ4, mitochondrial-like n=1 Tax=Salvia splendens TaxID=180675 RepID=UPI001C26203A|nr:tRNAse Z TRZ4, mitochondrial-like [Salvia splendens]
MNMINRQLAQLANSMGELQGNSGKLPSIVHVPEKANVSKKTSGEPSGTKLLRDVASEEELNKPLPQIQDPFFLDETLLAKDETKGVLPKEDPPKETEPMKETPAQNVPKRDSGKAGEEPKSEFIGAAGAQLPASTEELSDGELEKEGDTARSLLPTDTLPPQVELKKLPANLKYAFLGEKDSYPVIISSSLTKEHHIKLEEGAKAHRDSQRKVNPKMWEEILKEILKLLSLRIIFSVPDSEWAQRNYDTTKKEMLAVVYSFEKFWQYLLGSKMLAENLLKFHLRPYANMGLDRSSIPKLTSHSEIIQELLSEIPEARDASKNVTRLLSGCASVTEEPWLLEDVVPSCLEYITREDMEIVLLGTGSSQPSKYRNVSSIFINLFSKGSILLDCGEGSLGQLKRRFGVQGADEAIKGFKCIWISHIHADHHTGLASILARRHDLLKGSPHEPTLVVGPYQLNWFLSAYQKLEDLDLRFLDCSHTTEDALEAFDSNEGNPSKGVDSSLCKILGELGLEALVSFSVIHCPGAYGVVLQAASRINSAGKTIPGWKVVYSGDTRPCPKLVWAARRATVLIHEATFEDGMMDEAVSKKHSTTIEAVEIGNSAGTYRIILTHFSQRYSKIPVFNEAHMHKTCVAFDMMSVNLADVHALPRVLPYLKVLFRDEITIADDSEDV